MICKTNAILTNQLLHRSAGNELIPILQNFTYLLIRQWYFNTPGFIRKPLALCLFGSFFKNPFSLLGRQVNNIIKDNFSVFELDFESRHYFTPKKREYD